MIGGFFYFMVSEDEFTQDEAVPEEEDLSFVLANEEEGENEKLVDKERIEEVYVDVKGEVKNPGVYEISADERIQTVIKHAGGFTKEADETAINLAQKVQDEMVIYVPTKGEGEVLPTIPSLEEAIVGSETGDSLVRVNDATEEELTTLQGIGPAKAKAIITYREEHGPYEQVEDLLEVSGIGEKTLETIKEDIIVP